MYRGRMVMYVQVVGLNGANIAGYVDWFVRHNSWFEATGGRHRRGYEISGVLHAMQAW